MISPNSITAVFFFFYIPTVRKFAINDDSCGAKPCRNFQFWAVNGMLPTTSIYIDGTINFTDIYFRKTSQEA